MHIIVFDTLSHDLKTQLTSSNLDSQVWVLNGGSQESSSSKLSIKNIQFKQFPWLTNTSQFLTAILHLDAIVPHTIPKVIFVQDSVTNI